VFKLESDFVTTAEFGIGEYLAKSEQRLSLFIEIAMDVRSLINIANGIEFEQY
jgi:hypothetical protein